MSAEVATALLLIAVPIAFNAAFFELGRAFDYPNILRKEPDEILRRSAVALAEAETFRFDLSDLQPSEFGGTVGQGLFKLFQDFLANPDNVDGIAKQMEDAAAKAYGG